MFLATEKSLAVLHSGICGNADDIQELRKEVNDLRSWITELHGTVRDLTGLVHEVKVHAYEVPALRNGLGDSCSYAKKEQYVGSEMDKRLTQLEPKVPPGKGPGLEVVPHKAPPGEAPPLHLDMVHAPFSRHRPQRSCSGHPHRHRAKRHPKSRRSSARSSRSLPPARPRRHCRS